MLHVDEMVRLKSGGPKMIVETIEGELGGESVGCVWFEEGQHHRETFTVDVLESIDPRYRADFLDPLGGARPEPIE